MGTAVVELDHGRSRGETGSRFLRALTTMPLFSDIVMVDWSANGRPKLGKDSIWIGHRRHDAGGRWDIRLWNPATRFAAAADLIAVLDSVATAGGRALVGFDFALGYPAGMAARLGAGDWAGVWTAVAARIEDAADNANNRFRAASALNQAMTGQPGPFWGCPRSAETDFLRATTAGRAMAGLDEFRIAERRTHGRGTGAAQSVFKLAYPGSVGSQVLMGLPVLQRLRLHFGGRLAVWPFETGWRPLDEAGLQGVSVVLAEIYPSLNAVMPEPGEIKDRAQMRTLCEHFAALDGAGRLGAVFGPDATSDPALKMIVEREEGWILGV